MIYYIFEIVNAINVYREIVKNILPSELGMMKLSVRWIPHFLTQAFANDHWWRIYNNKVPTLTTEQ